MAATRFPKLRSEEQPTRAQDNIASVLDPLAKAVGDTPIMGAPPPSWIRPDIISTSGYAQVTTGSTPFLPVTAYHKDALGYVHGKVGLVTAAGVAGNITAFNIPKDYRPAELTLQFMGDGGGNAWETFIRPNGDFVVMSAVGAGGIVVGVFNYLAEA